ncbi:MAG: FG-GAP-like repeat-containing protein [Candidatus Hydrogenedentota bacterium]
MRIGSCIAIGLLVAGSVWGDGFRFHSSTFRVGPFPTSIAAADLNGDGIPEIVTANRGHLSDPSDEIPGGEELSLLVATKKLAYVAEPPLSAGFGPYAVAIANIDALKEPDLVVVNFMATRNRDLSLLRNIGDNLFEPHHFGVDDEALRYTQRRDGVGNPVFTTPGLTALVIDDFDRDGYRDVVATGWSSDTLVYFPGDADTYFGVPVLVPIAGNPRDLASHDFDRDGNKDLVIALYSTNEIALLKGNGDGTFEEVNRFSSRGTLPSSVALGDINGDGKKDLIVGHRHADDSVVIFYGDGKFEFSVAQELLFGEDRKKIESDIRDVLVEDFNEDGKPDLAIGCAASRKIIILTNTTKKDASLGTFKREKYTVKKGSPQALCSADFNGDGKLDIGVALWDENRVTLLLGR